jgi:hypothetical protein
VLKEVYQSQHLLHTDKEMRLNFYEAQSSLATLSFSTLDSLWTMSVHRSLTTAESSRLRSVRVPTWIPTYSVQAVVMRDMRIGRHLTDFLPIARSSPCRFRNVRRLAFHHVHIKYTGGSFTWATIWSGACASWSQLTEVKIEDCGYLYAPDPESNASPLALIEALDRAAFLRLQKAIDARST